MIDPSSVRIRITSPNTTIDSQCGRRRRCTQRRTRKTRNKCQKHVKFPRKWALFAMEWTMRGQDADFVAIGHRKKANRGRGGGEGWPENIRWKGCG